MPPFPFLLHEGSNPQVPVLDVTKAQWAHQELRPRTFHPLERPQLVRYSVQRHM